MLYKKKKNNEKLIIIGSGPAGYTAAIYAARANLKPILITGLQKGGQLIKTDHIENWPGRFHKTTGLELMHDLEKHALKLKTRIISDQVIDVNFSNTLLKVICEENQYTSYAVIIATGSSPKLLGLKQEKKFMGQGVSTCATCDGFFYKNKIVAIIGGGNTAVEEALYLSNIVNKIHLIHRREHFTAEKILIQRLQKKISLGKIILHMKYTMKNIIDNHNKISKIEIQEINNVNNIKTIPVSGIFIAIGSIPNTKIFQNHININNGYIEIVNQKTNYRTQTNISGVFAAGDVVDYIYKQAITSAASGCMAALDAEKYLNSLNIHNQK